jgi:hypothetical protein
MTSPFRESEHVAKVAEYERKLSDLDAEQAWLDARIQKLEGASPTPPAASVIVLIAFLFIPFLGFCGSCAYGTMNSSMQGQLCPTATAPR